jgi:hypothetical protein
MAHLVKGVSVAELAGREGLSERRMRAIVQDILSRRMPEPPAEFLALQVARLNEAMIVAHGAMGNGNLRAVECVMKITRELDRYHGFAEAIEARSATAERRRLAAPGARDARPPIRLQMAPQAIENLQLTPANGAPLEAARSLEEPAADASPAGLTGLAATEEVSPAPTTDVEPAPPAPALEARSATAEERRLAALGARDSRPEIRMEMAPQAIENPQFAPGNEAPPGAAGSLEERAAEASPVGLTDPAAMAEASSAPAAVPEPAPTPPALKAPPASDRLQMAPQAIENSQFAPGNEAPPEATGSLEGPATEVSPADPADPAATSQAAPGAETDPRSSDEGAPAGPLDPDPAETVPAVPPPGMVAANVILPPCAALATGSYPLYRAISAAGA